MSQVQSLNIFREKHILELNSYKEKLDGMLRSLSAQLEGLDKNIKAHMNKVIEISEKSIRYDMNALSNRIGELRLENNKAIFDINKMFKDINIEYDKILVIRSEVGKDFDMAVEEMKQSHNDTVDSFEKFKDEFSKIKGRFIDICEFIKDVRFRRNINEKVDKKEIKQLVDQLSFKKNKSYTNREMQIDAESEVKKYINGTKDEKNQMYDNLEEEVVYTFSEMDSKDRKIKSTTDLMNIKNDRTKPPKSSKTVKNNLVKISDSKSKLRTNSVKNEIKLIIRDTSSEARKLKSSKSNTEHDRVRTASDSNRFIRDKLNISNDNKPNISPDNNDSQSSSIEKKKEMSKTTYIKGAFERIEEKRKNEEYDSEGGTSEDEDDAKIIRMKKTEYNDMEVVSVAKYEQLVKKIADTETRLYEIEQNAKKKLDELATQVKVYIPINFTSYVKPNIEKQINIETYKNESNQQNMNYNILDPSMIQNPQQNKTKALRGDSRKSRTVVDNQKLKKVV
jgi:hypothetical protein